jgi:hypothetical protein
MVAVRIARQDVSISILGRCQWRRQRGDDGMEKEDVELMEVALKSIYHICQENNGEGCNDCPANGLGKLCHHGRISCCAPHGWWGVEEADDDK